MKVAIIGSGNVGYAFGKALLENDHEVIFHDIVKKNLPNNLKFTMDFEEAAKDADVVIVTVPTELSDNGDCDLSIFKKICHKFANVTKKFPKRRIFIQKSTCPPGSSLEFIDFFDKEYGLKNGKHYDYVVFPSFLNMGTPLEDEVIQRKCVVGLINGKTLARKAIEQKMQSLLNWAEPEFSSYVEVELVKYVNNIFHAGILSIWNELFLLGKKLGVEMQWIAEVTPREPGLESIYRVFGKAWGGVCLPKDTQAFLKFAGKKGIKMPLLSAIIEINEIMSDQYGIREEHWKELMNKSHAQKKET